MNFFSINNKNDIPFSQDLLLPVTNENFNETYYLEANLDVKKAIQNNQISSGKSHFKKFGFKENRFLRVPINKLTKKYKLEILKEILKPDLQYQQTKSNFNFLTDDLLDQFNIISTDLISNNDYDNDVINLIEKNRNGLILDCGAGNRNKYYKNVINLEIVDYPSTDVLAVGEKLPFKDNSFDAVISIAVLEHVKYPWMCANEILRVLKPGGDLICCVPFLQPLHGYPHHYYNMTAQGLQNLFSPNLEIIKHEVPSSTSPIWTLTWILESYANGLDSKTRSDFINLKISELIQKTENLLSKNYVTELSVSKKFELASATVLHGRKI